MLDSIRLADSVCFVGDSLTEGTKNGGYGWYEPILSLFPQKKFSTYAKGATTSRYFSDNSSAIAEIGADLYIMAFGCNDIRYRDPLICAMHEGDYICNVRKLVEYVRSVNSDARFIFIAPWMSLEFDVNFRGNGHNEKIRLYKEFTEALKEYCKKMNLGFINPNPYLFDNIDSPEIVVHGHRNEDILLDFIHPNAGAGVKFYCETVIRASRDNF